MIYRQYYTMLFALQLTLFIIIQLRSGTEKSIISQIQNQIVENVCFLKLFVGILLHTNIILKIKLSQFLKKFALIVFKINTKTLQYTETVADYQW